MTEREPLFGRMVEALQNRYTANRVFRGSATLESESEPVLRHLKEKGLRGIPDALREEQTRYRTECWQDITKLLLRQAYVFLLITIYGRDDKRLPIEKFGI